MDWLTTIVLLSISSVAFYGIGRLFGIDKFFTSILVGLSASGLLVGTLANLSAGLIRPTILIITLLGIVLFLKELSGVRFNRFLLVIGLLLLILNFPSRVFIKDNQFLYNLHYPYFSNQSTEMLNAKYYDRLRVADFFSFEWSRYHFFNSGVQASLSGLLPQPGLLTYLMAQLLIAVYVVLAILENLFDMAGFNKKTVIASVIWLSVGLTLLGASLAWNLATTGPLSVFAIVALLTACYRKNYSQALIFALILGASAFRLLPIGLLVSAWLIYRVVYNRQRLSPAIIIFGILFLLYNVVTLVTGETTGGDSIKSLFGFNLQTAFDDGWASGLSAYKTIGSLLAVVFNNQFFSEANFNNVMGKVFSSQLSAFLLVVLCATFVAAIAAGLKKFSKKILLALVVIGVVTAWLAAGAPTATQKLLAVAVPYGLAMALLVTGFDVAVVTAIVFLGALLIQFSSLSFAVKIPVMLVAFDLAVWGLLGIWLFSRATLRLLFASGALAIMLFFIYRFPISEMMTIKPATAIDIAPLLDKSVPRGGDCTFESNSPSQTNLYQAILGCHLDREPDEIKTESLSSRFVGKEQ